MADTKAETPKPLDWTAAEKHFTAAREKIFSFSGKDGHNPHLYWQKIGGPDLDKGLAAKDAASYPKIAGIVFEPPKVS